VLDNRKHIKKLQLVFQQIFFFEKNSPLNAFTVKMNNKKIAKFIISDSSVSFGMNLIVDNIFIADCVAIDFPTFVQLCSRTSRKGLSTQGKVFLPPSRVD
jgi:hypothetical protein